MEDVTNGGPAPQDELAGLVDQLREMVADRGWPDLVDELPVMGDDDPVRIAFVGPHNAGKSSVIAALTRDLSIKRSGKPETSEATRYNWRRHIDLVDLPGWFSGFAEHTDRADDDLRRNADLVVFVLTVELGDELIVDAFDRVLGELGFAERALVVVNKSQTEDSDFDNIRDEVHRRLGRFAGVRVIATDAQDFLDTISGESDLDEESIGVLEEDSGMEHLAECLRAMVGEHGASARAQARTNQSLRVVDEALKRMVPDAEEQAARESLDELEATVLRGRERLDDLALSYLTRLETAISAIAERVLDDDRLSEADHQALWDAAMEPADELGEAAEVVLGELRRDRDVVVERLEKLGSKAPSPPPFGPTRPGSQSDPITQRVFQSMGFTLKGSADAVGTFGDNVAKEGFAPGSATHTWVKKLRPAKKFAPHGQKKAAKKLATGGKIASKAPMVAPAVEELWKWGREIKARRQIEKEASSVRSRYAEWAETKRRGVQERFDSWVDENLESVEHELAAGRAPLLDHQAARDLARARFEETARSIRALRSSEPPTPE